MNTSTGVSIDTELICGSEAAPDNLVIGTLPDVIVLRAGTSSGCICHRVCWFR